MTIDFLNMTFDELGMVITFGVLALALGYTGATGAFVAAIAISGTSSVYDAGIHGK